MSIKYLNRLTVSLIKEYIQGGVRGNTKQATPCHSKVIAQ